MPPLVTPPGVGGRSPTTPVTTERSVTGATSRGVQKRTRSRVVAQRHTQERAHESSMWSVSSSVRELQSEWRDVAVLLVVRPRVRAVGGDDRRKSPRSDWRELWRGVQRRHESAAGRCLALSVLWQSACSGNVPGTPSCGSDGGHRGDSCRGRRGGADSARTGTLRIYVVSQGHTRDAVRLEEGPVRTVVRHCTSLKDATERAERDTADARAGSDAGARGALGVGGLSISGSDESRARSARPFDLAWIQTGTVLCEVSDDDCAHHLPHFYQLQVMAKVEPYVRRLKPGATVHVTQQSVLPAAGPLLNPLTSSDERSVQLNLDAVRVHDVFLSNVSLYASQTEARMQVQAVAKTERVRCHEDGTVRRESIDKLASITLVSSHFVGSVD